MVLSHVAPVMLTMLLAPLFFFLAWGFWRFGQDENVAHHFFGLRDDLLMAFVLLAALAIAAFVAYVLMA